jgi:hypothetical protein
MNVRCFHRVGKTTVAKAYLSGALPVAVQSEETLFKTMVVDDFKAHVQVVIPHAHLSSHVHVEYSHFAVSLRTMYGERCKA